MQIETGELLADRAELRVALLADTEELGVTSSRVAPGFPAPPLHVHDRHADSFLVLGGAVRLELEGEERVVEPQSWIQVPAGIVHTFAAAGAEPARFVNVHAPSCGLGTYMRALLAAQTEDDRRRAWDGFDARAVTEGQGRSAEARLEPRLGPGPELSVVVRRLGGEEGEEGETITQRKGRRVTLLSDIEELAVTDSVYGPGERGPDDHVHREHADAWLVLEGSLVFRFRDEVTFEVTFEAPAGTFVVVPPNVVHAFSNESEVTTRFLNIHVPSCGFGDYLRGKNPGFDQHDPPPDGGDDPRGVLVRAF